MADNLNVQPNRGPSVWDRSTAPRWDSIGGGALLAVAGVVLTVVGARVLYEGVSSKRRPARRRAAAPAETYERVTEESMESFPASDPPSWTSSGVVMRMPPRGM